MLDNDSFGLIIGPRLFNYFDCGAALIPIVSGLHNVLLELSNTGSILFTQNHIYQFKSLLKGARPVGQPCHAREGKNAEIETLRTSNFANTWSYTKNRVSSSIYSSRSVD